MKALKHFISMTMIALSATPSIAQTLPSNTVRMGDGSASDKKLVMNRGGSNPYLKWSESLQQLLFSNDGNSEKAIGSGGGGASGISVITNGNPDFEAGAGNWTASAGSFTIGTTMFDKKNGVFNSSSSGQTISNTAVSVNFQPGLKNASAVASCFFQTTATDYKIQVFDGTNVLSENVIPASSVAIPIFAPFVMPSTGTIQLRVISQSDAADINLDNCYLGQSVFTPKSQAVLYGTLTITGCSGDYTTTNTSFSNLGTNTSCSYVATGNAQAPGTQILAISFPSLPAGDYIVQINGQYSTASNKSAYYRLTDGTNFSREVIEIVAQSGGTITVPESNYSISYGGSQGATTFELQGRADSGGGANVRASGFTQVIKVWRYPSSTEQGQYVNLQPSYGVLKAQSGSLVTPSTTSATFATISDAGFGSATKTYQGSAQACASGNNLCIGMGKMAQGIYDVSVNATLYSDASTDCGYRLYDGTNQIGAFRTVSGSQQHSNSGLHGYLVVPSDTYNKEISLQAYRDGGSGNCNVYFDVTGKAGDIEFQVKPLTSAVADLILKNSVQTSGNGQTQLFSFAFGGSSLGTTNCTSSPCNLYNSSGGVSQVVRLGTGHYQYQMAAGLCSQPLICNATTRDVATATFAYPSGGANTSTTFDMENIDVTGAAKDAFEYVQCSCQK